MPRTLTLVGPQDHGRHMTLDEFDTAEGQPGFLYELNREVVVVVDVPRPSHLAQVQEARDQLVIHKRTHRGRIHTIASGSECKILLSRLGTERHPDLAVYLTPPPRGRNLWARWIPAIVIEMVSRGSEVRDYEEKRNDYLLFGVREYWIVDNQRGAMLVLRRRGNNWTERIVCPPEVYQTRLLPGFEFNLEAVFRAVEEQ